MFDEQNEKFDWVDEFGDVRTEGRLLTAEFDDFYLVDAYVPNAKDSLERLKFREKVWDPALLEYMQMLEKTKPVVLCGDMNVAHEEIDIARPKQNVGHAGFTDEERQGMTNYLAAGFVDSFRFKNPEKVKYSWWSYRGQARANNVGWRIDYFLLSDSLKDKLVEADICDEVMGSDHCPVMIEMKDLSLNANMVEMEVVNPTVILTEEVIEKTPETLQAKLDLGV
jgi:exodeoxyribonuclease-3